MAEVWMADMSLAQGMTQYIYIAAIYMTREDGEKRNSHKKGKNIRCNSRSYDMCLSHHILKSNGVKALPPKLYIYDTTLVFFSSSLFGGWGWQKGGGWKTLWKHMIYQLKKHDWKKIHTRLRAVVPRSSKYIFPWI